MRLVPKIRAPDGTCLGDEGPWFWRGGALHYPSASHGSPSRDSAPGRLLPGLISAAPVLLPTAFPRAFCSVASRRGSPLPGNRVAGMPRADVGLAQGWGWGGEGARWGRGSWIRDARAPELCRGQLHGGKVHPLPCRPKPGDSLSGCFFTQASSLLTRTWSSSLSGFGEKGLFRDRQHPGTFPRSVFIISFFVLFCLFQPIRQSSFSVWGFERPKTKIDHQLLVKLEVWSNACFIFS